MPAGFIVVGNGGTDEASKVDYTYNGDGRACVQDGIVIEDSKGNQFVWIPVGDIKNKDGSTTIITLGRYTFDARNGTPNLKQNADDYSKIVTIQAYYQERTTNLGNTAAKNLGEFVTKTKAVRGYYLARYEASEGDDGKANSQANKPVWNYITQPNAATAAREMYSSNYFESDLVNSYMWDTAIVFIQNYSGNTNYANKNYKVSANTGKVGDKVCNIHDMASNTIEWTTERCGHDSFNCTLRGGGNYSDSNPHYSAVRGSLSREQYSGSIGFRSGLYVK